MYFGLKPPCHDPVMSFGVGSAAQRIDVIALPRAQAKSAMWCRGAMSWFLLAIVGTQFADSVLSRCVSGLVLRLCRLVAVLPTPTGADSVRTPNCFACEA